MAFALWWSGYVEEAASEAVMLRAEELLDIATEHDFAWFKAVGPIHRAGAWP